MEHCRGSKTLHNGSNDTPTLKFIGAAINELRACRVDYQQLSNLFSYHQVQGELVTICKEGLSSKEQEGFSKNHSYLFFNKKRSLKTGNQLVSNCQF